VQQIQNPKPEIQDPKSKRPRLSLPHKERILQQSKIQNPKPQIQDPKPKIQDPKSKFQTGRLDFGFSTWGVGAMAM